MLDVGSFAAVLASVEGTDEDVVELAVLVVIDDGATLVSFVSTSKNTNRYSVSVVM